MPTEVHVVIDQAAINRFTSWAGPVGASMTRLAKEMTYRQSTYANRRTGKLASSMEYKKGVWKRGIMFYAGSNVKYARFVEEGTRPHEIKPKTPGGHLVFFWPKAGRVVHLKHVNHPGTRPYRFLVKGMEKAISVWNRAG